MTSLNGQFKLRNVHTKATSHIYVEMSNLTTLSYQFVQGTVTNGPLRPADIKTYPLLTKRHCNPGVRDQILASERS